MYGFRSRASSLFLDRRHSGHFEFNKGKDKTGSLSHTLFTGSSYFVPDEYLSELYNTLGEDLRNGNMPAINEIHTKKFPMYLDIDLQTHVDELTRDAIFKISTIANKQISRFYTSNTRPFSCIICTKSNGGVQIKDGVWKYGLHMHWPDLILEVEQAFYIRESIIAGLDFEEWESELGISRPPWNTIVDEAVYRRDGKAERSGGLRMVGAPKAKKCDNCATLSSCHLCGLQNGRYIMDNNVYVLFEVVFVGENGLLCIDTEKKGYYTNKAKLIHKTSVRRVQANLDVTPGFKPYIGCPTPFLFATTSTGKRKCTDTDDSASKRLGVRFKKSEVVEELEVVDIVKSLLIKHSPHYARSRMAIRFDGKAYNITLTGDGGRFCLNKGECHSSQHVFMEIVKRTSAIHYGSRMRCFNKKQVNRLDGMCQTFKSPFIDLSTKEVARLFVSTAVLTSTDPAARSIALAASIRAKEKARDESRAMRALATPI